MTNGLCRYREGIGKRILPGKKEVAVRGEGSRSFLPEAFSLAVPSIGFRKDASL